MHTTRSKLNTISLAYTQAKKILVMNQKGGVGKSTIVAGLISQLHKRGQNVELIDYDKQGSTYHWASRVIPNQVQHHKASFNSLSEMALKIRVNRDTDFVIFDSPSNFTIHDMTKYAYFVDNIIIPMAPSPIDLHASLPFIKSLIDTGLLSRRKIELAFIINRCNSNDSRVTRVHHLLSFFRDYPTLGEITEREGYQTAFYHQELICTELDTSVWNTAIKWLSS